jgi:hypothetical protein
MAADLVKHLATHPLDTDARERLASIYADHYHRLDLACDQLEHLIGDPRHAAKRVVHWLNLLADLQVRHTEDDALARQTLERIIHLYPGSAAAQVARNRMDHIKLEFKGKEKSQAVRLGSYEQDIGLKTKRGRFSEPT